MSGLAVFELDGRPFGVVYQPLPPAHLDPVDVARFAKRVDISGGLYACWPWTGPVGLNGYGRTQRDRHPMLAHRFSLEIDLRRPLAPGMLACHHCDNRVCVNPRHLYEGSAFDNARDAKARRRAVPPPHLRGEEVATSKLTADQVREIRVLIAEGRSVNSTAIRFGVSRLTIDRIVDGRAWKHVR